MSARHVSTWQHILDQTVLPVMLAHSHFFLVPSAPRPCPLAGAARPTPLPTLASFSDCACMLPVGAAEQFCVSLNGPSSWQLEFATRDSVRVGMQGQRGWAW